VCGDFNAEPDSDEIRFMRGLTGLGGKCVYFADSFGIAGEGPGFTFARRNPYAAQVREPNRRIDYIFVRGPDDRGRGEPLSARVCFDEPTHDVWPTDHFGVSATISV
jgi:endonuclease/exonuclease/phosphatase family metal-dependent hydrolase